MVVDRAGTIEQLREKVRRFRIAVEKAVCERRTGRAISSFPSGCCDKPFLVLFLYDLGYRNIIRRKGDVTRYGGYRHDWIEVDSITVDITADQFQSHGLSPVIVAAHSDWHAELPKIEGDGCAWNSDLDAFYKRHRSQSSCRLFGADAYAEIVMCGELGGLFPKGRGGWHESGYR